MTIIPSFWRQYVFEKKLHPPEGKARTITLQLNLTEENPSFKKENLDC